MGVDHFLKNNVLIMYSRNEWKKKTTRSSLLENFVSESEKV